MEKVLQAVFTAAVTAICAYMQVLALPLIVLLVVMIIDYLTGISEAWHSKQLNSRIGLIGIVKKVGYIMLVAVGIVVDYLISSAFVAAGLTFDTGFVVGLLVTIWLIINELISILENLSQLGVPMPGFLKKLVQRLKNTVNEKTDN